MKSLIKIPKPFILSLGIICSSLSLANSSLAASIDDPDRRTYLSFELGASLSMDAGMEVPIGPQAGSAGFWDPAPQGYDSDLGQSENYGVGFGYNVSPLVSLELNYNDRPSFTYSKFQSPPGSGIGPRIRSFDLENKSLMLNGLVNVNSLKYARNSFSIAPFVDLGVGVSRNTVSNFHSVATTGGIAAAPGTVFSMENSNTVSSISYQAGLGVAATLDAFWEMRLGYRYFNGGKFETGKYIVDDPDDITPLDGAGVTVPAWKGELRSNEFYAKLIYNF